MSEISFTSDPTKTHRVFFEASAFGPERHHQTVYRASLVYNDARIRIVETDDRGNALSQIEEMITLLQGVKNFFRRQHNAPRKYVLSPDRFDHDGVAILDSGPTPESVKAQGSEQPITPFEEGALPAPASTRVHEDLENNAYLVYNGERFAPTGDGEIRPKYIVRVEPGRDYPATVFVVAPGVQRPERWARQPETGADLGAPLLPGTGKLASAGEPVAELTAEQEDLLTEFGLVSNFDSKRKVIVATKSGVNIAEGIDRHEGHEIDRSKPRLPRCVTCSVVPENETDSPDITR